MYIYEFNSLIPRVFAPSGLLREALSNFTAVTAHGCSILHAQTHMHTIACFFAPAGGIYASKGMSVARRLHQLRHIPWQQTCTIKSRQSSTNTTEHSQQLCPHQKQGILTSANAI